MRFGFEQYETPVIETLDLLKRKGSEEITEQIYHFEDKSGREIALRPEMTPSLVRLVLQKRNLKMPLKWFSIPQCFRYERMSKGRKREHYQWNVDVIGDSSPLVDAELVGVAIYALQSLGLSSDEIVFKVNNRQLIMDILSKLGFSMEHFMTACLILDKRGKIDDEVIKKI